MVSGLLPIAAWALYLSGGLSSGATLVAVSTLGAARWFAWTTASLVSQLPSARVWTRRTVAMTGVGAYSAAVPGVDLSAGTAPAPAAAPRHPLRRLDLVGFSAVHEDGTVGVHDVDLTVERGQLVLVVGPVGSGKSSLLRALAGIVHHTGALRWNGAAGRPSRSCSCGPTRSATWPSCRGCCPARSPTTSGSATRWTRPARCRPRSWSTTWRPPAAGSGC